VSFQLDPTWAELVVAVLGAIVGWFARHFTNKP
jgi:hypothetical protein